MNITYYKKRIKKFKELLKSKESKYSDSKIEGWIILCRNKIKKIKENKPKIKVKK